MPAKEALASTLVGIILGTPAVAGTYFDKMESVRQEKPSLSRVQRRAAVLDHIVVDEKLDLSKVLDLPSGFYDFDSGSALVMPDMAIVYRDGKFKSFTKDGQLLGRGSYDPEELDLYRKD